MRHLEGDRPANRKPDIGYLPTPDDVVEAALTLAALTEHDTFYDLGSGDGRVVIAAAQQFGVRGVGIDIDPDRIQQACQNAAQAGVGDRVAFRQQDLFESDFTDATVVFLYLLPHLNLRLRSTLQHQLQPGSRIISRDFDMGDWPPNQVLSVPGTEDSLLYLWIVQGSEPSGRP